jgi:hypothetical protein
MSSSEQLLEQLGQMGGMSVQIGSLRRYLCRITRNIICSWPLEVFTLSHPAKG